MAKRKEPEQEIKAQSHVENPSIEKKKKKNKNKKNKNKNIEDSSTNAHAFPTFASTSSRPALIVIEAPGKTEEKKFLPPPPPQQQQAAVHQQKHQQEKDEKKKQQQKQEQKQVPQQQQQQKPEGERKKKKRRKGENNNATPAASPAASSNPPPSSQNKKKQQKQAAAASHDPTVDENGNKMSQMQIEMRKKLMGGRFRMLNEELYKTTGDEAYSRYQDNPDLFRAYHEGYREQAQQWPVNPLHQFIEYLSKITKNIKIADMGCGEGELGRQLMNLDGNGKEGGGGGAKKEVFSFDLVAAAPHITACNIANVPLADETVDVVVFCLSLMGSNYIDFLKEGMRILKTGGTMLIAEVRSRMEKESEFIQLLRHLGLEIKRADNSNKMFIVLRAQKVKNVPFTAGKNAPKLKPCLYKRR